jgi:hypothetical protein
VTDDDLDLDHPVVAALRAPAQPHELAGEDAALAMFGRTMPHRRRRRALGRVGVGGAGVVLGLTLTGGVAAAYTTGLPDPMQDAAHAVLEPLPIPAPPTAEVRHLRQRLRAIARERNRARHAGTIGSPIPGATIPGSPSAAPTPSGDATLRGPAAVPPARDSASPAGSPHPSPSSTQPAASWTVSVSRRVVPVHSEVVLSGRLSRGDAALAGRRVYAAEFVVGQSGWRRVASGQTGSDGTVALTVPALTGNVRLRLVTGSGVTSPQLVVSVVPKLWVSLTRDQGQRVATVTADGGRAGDGLVLLRRDGDTWTRVGSTSLADGGTGQFTVPGPGQTRVRYRVRLPATARHTATFVEFLVPAR